MRTPESFEKEDIKKFLETLGPTCWHYAPFMKGFGKNGVPDRVGVYQGRFFGIEVKRDANTRPTPIQLRRMAEIQKAGGVAIAGNAEVVIAEFKRIFGV